MKGSYTDNRPDPILYGSFPEMPVIPLDLPAAIVLIEGLQKQITVLEAEILGLVQEHDKLFWENETYARELSEQKEQIALEFRLELRCGLPCRLLLLPALHFDPGLVLAEKWGKENLELGMEKEALTAENKRLREALKLYLLPDEIVALRGKEVKDGKV